MEKKMYETPEMMEVNVKVEDGLLTSDATLINPGGGGCTGETACLCPTDSACESED